MSAPSHASPPPSTSTASNERSFTKLEPTPFSRKTLVHHSPVPHTSSDRSTPARRSYNEYWAATYNPSFTVMGVTKTVLAPGNGVDVPQRGDRVAIDYTGNLFDQSQAANHNRGKQFDSSSGRGPLAVQIGVGQVIRGWDEAVMEMSLGEKSVITISSDYAYGARGFGNLIPPNSALVFEVHLLSINNKKA